MSKNNFINKKEKKSLKQVETIRQDYNSYNKGLFKSFDKKQFNKNWKGHVAQWIEPLSGVRRDAGSSLLRKSHHAHRHLKAKEKNNRKNKIEKQAYSLNKASVWRTEISYEFGSVVESNLNQQHNNYKNDSYIKLSVIQSPILKI